jgi:hypothetical protein
MASQVREHLISADRHGLGLVRHLERLAQIDPERHLQWQQAAMLARRARGTVIGQLAGEKIRSSS